MQELKDRILKEGRVLPGNIIKVDGFLNHRIDTRLMRNIADEFGKHFNMDEVTMILTAEASGIALATMVAQRFDKPLLYAKKAKSDNIEGGLYQSEIHSYTYKKKVTLLVSKDWIGKDDRVLIVDDFMRGGGTAHGMLSLLEEFNCKCAGMCFVMAMESAEKAIENQKSLMIMGDIVDGQVADIRVSDWVK